MVIAFDVGGTNLRSALVGDDLQVRSRRERPTPRGDAAALHAALAEEAAAQCGQGEAPAALGIAMAGFTNVRRGIVHTAPSLGLHEFELVAPLRRAVGLPVRLVNDVNAAAWAEAAAARCADLVAIFIGTGVGTGFVCNGTLIEGHRGTAAEGGHAIFRADGPACPGGHRGCYEVYLGGKALAARAAEAGLPADAAELMRRWRDGLPAAALVMEDAVAALQSLCRLLVTLLDPERIVLGGGVGERTPELLDAARRAVDPHPLAAAAGPVVVEPARLGEDAGLLGAALLARTLAGSVPSRS